MLKFDAAFRSEMRTNRAPLAIAVLCMIFAFSAPAFSMPFLFPEVIEEFGWTREQATLLASAKYLTGAVAAILMGRFIDYAGPLIGLTISSIFGGVAMIGFLWMEDLPTYYFLGLLLGVAGPGTIISVKLLVSRCFHRSQGTAMGIALLGSSIGSMIVPLVITALIAAFGWRIGFAAMSVGVWLIGLPLLVFGIVKGIAKGGPDASSEIPSALPADAKWSSLLPLMKRPVFWLLGGAVFLGGLVDQAFIQHQVLIFGDLDMSPEIIALGVSGIGVIGFFARVLVGNLFDRTSNRGAAAMYVVLGVGCLLALLLANPFFFALFIVFRATSHAGVLLDTTVMTKHVFGTQNLGSLLGIYTAFVTVGFAIGPWLMGRLFESAGSYGPAFVVLGSLAILAAVLMWLVRPTYWEKLKASHASRGADNASRPPSAA